MGRTMSEMWRRRLRRRLGDCCEPVSLALRRTFVDAQAPAQNPNLRARRIITDRGSADLVVVRSARPGWSARTGVALRGWVAPGTPARRAPPPQSVAGAPVRGRDPDHPGRA